MLYTQAGMPSYQVLNPRSTALVPSVGSPPRLPASHRYVPHYSELYRNWTGTDAGIPWGRNAAGNITVDSSKARSNLDVLRLCLQDLGWREYPLGRRDAPCDIYWNSARFEDFQNKVLATGKVNKFPGINDVLRKSHVALCIRIMKTLFPGEYDFFPHTWLLPQEYQEFFDHASENSGPDAMEDSNILSKDNVELDTAMEVGIDGEDNAIASSGDAQKAIEYLETPVNETPDSSFANTPIQNQVSEEVARRRIQSSKRTCFIVKPSAGSQGDGIFLLKDPQFFMPDGSNYVVQKYYPSPFLLQGYKFDLRVYVVVMSLDPLHVCISRAGLARFCTVPYSKPVQDNMKTPYMHLTNYSVNKTSDEYVHDETDNCGSKRTIKSVFDALEKMGHDTSAIWKKIEDIVMKTLLALTPELRIIYMTEISHRKYQFSCFQILGFDILLLHNLTPILLEVNSNPSLRIDFEQQIEPGVYQQVPSRVDEEVKKAIVKETLTKLVPPRKRHILNRMRKSRAVGIDELSTYCLTQTCDGFHDIEEMVLKDVTTRDYDSQFSAINEIADLFQDCMGVRGSTKIGLSGFQKFGRKCQKIDTSFKAKLVEDLYMDAVHKWAELDGDECLTHGLGLLGFMDTFCKVAEQLFPKAENTMTAVQQLIEDCKRPGTPTESLPAVDIEQSGKQSRHSKKQYSTYMTMFDKQLDRSQPSDSITTQFPNIGLARAQKIDCLKKIYMNGVSKPRRPEMCIDYQKSHRRLPKQDRYDRDLQKGDFNKAAGTKNRHPSKNLSQRHDNENGETSDTELEEGMDGCPVGPQGSRIHLKVRVSPIKVSAAGTKTSSSSSLNETGKTGKRTGAPTMTIHL